MHTLICVFNIVFNMDFPEIVVGDDPKISNNFQVILNHKLGRYDRIAMFLN